MSPLRRRSTLAGRLGKGPHVVEHLNSPKALDFIKASRADAQRFCAARVTFVRFAQRALLFYQKIRLASKKSQGENLVKGRGVDIFSVLC